MWMATRLPSQNADFFWLSKKKFPFCDRPVTLTISPCSYFGVWHGPWLQFCLSRPLPFPIPCIHLCFNAEIVPGLWVFGYSGFSFLIIFLTPPDQRLPYVVSLLPVNIIMTAYSSLLLLQQQLNTLDISWMCYVNNYKRKHLNKTYPFSKVDKFPKSYWSVCDMFWLKFQKCSEKRQLFFQPFFNFFTFRTVAAIFRVWI